MIKKSQYVHLCDSRSTHYNNYHFIKSRQCQHLEITVRLLLVLFVLILKMSLEAWLPSEHLRKRQQTRRCTCSECGSRGKLLASNEWDHHRRMERKRRAIDDMINVSASLTERLDSPTGSAHEESEQTPLFRTEKSEFEDSHEEEDAGQRWSRNVLRQVKQRLEENIIQEIRRLPLVFRSQPSRGAILQLDEASHLNTCAIEHERWLIRHRTLLRSLVHRYKRNPALSLQINNTLRKVESEIRLLEKAKMREWEHQQSAASRTNAFLVDTRK